MAPTSRMAQLASVIQTHTTIVDEHIALQKLPSPSFHVNAPPQLQLPEAISSSRDAVIEAMDELQALMLGPLDFLFNQIVQNHNNLISLQAIYRFQIATSFPIHGEASFAQIAETCRLNETDLTRMLRHAMTYRIFREPQKGIVAHTAASKTLAETPLLRDWIGQACEDMWPAASRVVDAMTTWPASEEPTQTGFNLAYNTKDPFFAEIKKTSERAQRFADAMSFFHAGPGLETAHVIKGYNWAVERGIEVIDVGGSHGSVAREIVNNFPLVRCLVQDLPEVIDSLKPQQLSQMNGRLKFEAYNFFTKQPHKGADIYFFRMIFHNWSDKYCIQILKNLIPALKHGAKVLINDFCLPDPGVLSAFKERDARCFDLAMKEIFNAKERDLNDWIHLFERADLRFKFLGVKKPPGSQLAIIEVSWAGVTAYQTM